MPRQYQINTETKLLLYTSKTFLNKQELTLIISLLRQSINWKVFLQLANHHRCSALVYNAFSNLKENSHRDVNIPNYIWEGLRNYYYQSLAKSFRLWQIFIKIKDAFNQSSIPCIPLKGIILARTVYPNPALRPVLADIDILIEESKLAIAKNKLEAMGFKFLKKESHVLLFKKEWSLLELHTRILPQWVNRVDMKLLWARAQRIDIEGSKILTLSPEDTLLSLSLQLRNDWPYFHLFRLCDINEIITKYSQFLDWQYLAKTAQQFGIKGTLYFYLQLCQSLLASPLPMDWNKIIKPRLFWRYILNKLLEKNINQLFSSFLQPMMTRRESQFLKITMNDYIWDSLKIFLHR